MAVQRVEWADYAKGLTIILVVYGHAVVGVAKDLPIDPTVFAYAMRPFSQFRMPVFFFVAGLFAAFSIKRDWPAFVDRSLLPLVYFFVLWNLLQWAARVAFAPWANDPIEPWFLLIFPIRPINITWFIWALMAYYLIAYATRGWPSAPIVAGAALLATIPVPEGWFYVYQQAPRFLVFFLLGIACSSWTLSLETRGRLRLLAAATAAYAVAAPLTIHLGIDEAPLIDYANSLLGIVWIGSLCMVLAERGHCAWLRWIGGWSLPIFVTHTIATAGARELLLRAGTATDPLLVIAAATLAGVALPIAFAWTLQRLGFPWLFERPGWFALGHSRALRAEQRAAATS